MARFSYEATNSSGQRVTGQLEASDGRQLLARLEAMDLKMHAFREMPPDPAVGTLSRTDRLQPIPDEAVAPAAGWHDPKLIESLADLAAAGLPLEEGLRALAEELPRKSTRKRLRQFSKRLEQGMPISDAIAAEGVPDDLRAILRASQTTAGLGQLLHNYARHLGHVGTIKHEIYLSLVYPFLVFSMTLCASFILATRVVPTFEIIFNDFDTPLPPPTLLVVYVCRLMRRFSWLIVLSLAFLLVASFILLKADGWRSHVTSILYRVPIVGRTLRYFDTARFVDLLSLLMDGDIPLPIDLRLAGEGTGSAPIQMAAYRLAHRVSQGIAINDGAADLAVFPATLLNSIRRGPPASSMTSLLRGIAEMFHQQSRQRAMMVAVVCGPILLVVAGCLVGFVVLSLFLPLVSLVQNLS